MRFCLMKNICPSCGAGLFSEEDMNDLRLLQSRAYDKDFASGLDETKIFDMALFIFDEIKSGYGRKMLEKMFKEIKENDSPADSGEVVLEQKVEAEPQDDEKKNEDWKERLRSEIKRDVLKDSPISSDDLDDEDNKVDRLKRIAKQYKPKTGSAVRRVT